MSEVLQISKSDLAGARDTGNKEFIETIFTKAEEVLKAGGSVHLMQVFSDASKEVADIIDDLDQLAHLKTIFLR
jgi:hypothetical protein